MKWIKRTAFWKLASRFKLALKQMKASASYMDRNPSLRTLRFFLAVEDSRRGMDLLHSFHAGPIRFHLRPMEWHLLEAVLMDREYGAADDLFADAPPALIIDAGANVGMFSVYAFLHWPQTEVLAIEPGPDTFDLLEKNRLENPGLKWRNFQCALWETNGSISFETEGISMAAHVSQNAGGLQVPAVRLDDFLEKNVGPGRRVSLLKMDIEGAEESVLRSAASSLRRVDAMIVEIHAGMCNERVVRDILETEFGHVRDLTAPSTQYPVVLASRRALASA